MEKQVIVYDKSDPKKHSVRFNTSEDDAAIDSIYIKRTHLGNPIPKKLKVTIEEVT
jgi:hypothetical protein